MPSEDQPSLIKRVSTAAKAHKARSIGIGAAVVVLIVAAVAIPLALGSNNTKKAAGTTTSSTKPSNTTSTTSGHPSTTKVTGTTSPACVTVPANHAVQLGVDVWWVKEEKTTEPQKEEAQSAAIAGYVANKLHANALSIGFPLFVANKTSTTVITTARDTPTPTDIGYLIAAAKKDGLQVSIRPLLDIGTNSKTYVWRGLLDPSNPGDFFASYFSALQPYLALAQSDGVTSFDYASEFISLTSTATYTPYWTTLIHQMSGVYHGQLDYAESTTQFGGGLDVVPDLGSNGVHTDAYFGAKGATPKTSENQLFKSWATHMCKRPASELAGAVLQEVGFDAQSGGYQDPSAVAGPPATSDLLYMQKVWFDMICQVVHTFHLAGVYFWNVDFDLDVKTLDGKSTSVGPTIWINRPGAAAVASCFTSFKS